MAGVKRKLNGKSIVQKYKILKKVLEELVKLGWHGETLIRVKLADKWYSIPSLKNLRYICLRYECALLVGKCTWSFWKQGSH